MSSGVAAPEEMAGWGVVPLVAATAAAAVEARVQKRKGDEEVSAFRLELDQWRHTGSVTGAPPADSRSRRRRASRQDL